MTEQDKDKISLTTKILVWHTLITVLVIALFYLMWMYYYFTQVNLIGYFANAKHFDFISLVLIFILMTPHILVGLPDLYKFIRYIIKYIIKKRKKPTK